MAAVGAGPGGINALIGKHAAMAARIRAEHTETVARHVFSEHGLDAVDTAWQVCGHRAFIAACAVDAHPHWCPTCQPHRSPAPGCTAVFYPHP